MSYSIYYDRAFICAGNKYIPLANSGSNNCYEYGIGNRMRCEKSWNVLNWKRSDQFLFSETEIKEIARDYDLYNQGSGMIFKSRNQCFAPGEFERWIINGMKRAYTIEEYVSFENGFFVLDYSANETKEWKQHPFQTTDELLSILENLKASKSLDIKLCNNREVYRPKTSRAPKTPLRASDLSEYYVLKGECDGNLAYFAGLNRKGGFRYTSYCPSSSVKVFRTEKDALQYLKKYHNRLLEKYNFAPERICKAV